MAVAEFGSLYRTNQNVEPLPSTLSASSFPPKSSTSCFKGGLDVETDSVEGSAEVVDKSTNAKLEVCFFWPFKGDYWIIDLDRDYEYAVVGHPSRDYTWILSRDAELEESTYVAILKRLLEKHYDVSRLIKTLHKS